MVIGVHEVAVMSRATVLIFEVLEKAWASLDCSLVDMKIEFGVNTKGNNYQHSLLLLPFNGQTDSI